MGKHMPWPETEHAFGPQGQQPFGNGNASGSVCACVCDFVGQNLWVTGRCWPRQRRLANISPFWPS